MQKIILVGYMGVGKTTIAGLLSEKTKINAQDLDKLIEAQTGLSIPEIFSQKGEIYFRKLEHELFARLVNNEENLILSTGGGTPCYANNHLLLKEENVVSVYLKASLTVILERLKSEGGTRPLLAGKSRDELQEFVAMHLFERSYFYNQARFTVSVDGKSEAEIADEIIALLN